MSMTTSEREEALQLVEDIQRMRATRRLTPTEVPKILLPYQAAWHRDESPVRLCKKSRRIGFSWGSLAAEAALEAALAKGMDQFYMGYNMAMAAEFIGDCAFFARAYQLAASQIGVTLLKDEKRDIVTYKIQLASGFKIEALSSCPYNWRSRQGHARIDEAAFHENLQEVIKGALAFRMWGGRIDIVSTLNGEDNPFTVLCKDVEAGKLPYSLHKVTFDDALAQGFYQRVCLVTDKEYSLTAEEKYREEIYADYPTPEDANEELDCIAKRGSGAFFTRLLLEHCHGEGIPRLRWQQPAEFVIEPDRLEIASTWIQDHLKPLIDAMPTGRRTVYSQDFGRSGDLSVNWVWHEERPGRWRQSFGVELRNIPFDVQQLITFYILDNIPLFQKAAFDARGNGQSHAEAALQKYGQGRVECVMFSAPWYAEWFPKYKQAMEGDLLRLDANEDVIADHRMVVMVQGRPGISGARVKGSDGQYRHGDSAVAGVLAYFATCQKRTEYGYTPAEPSGSVPSRNGHSDIDDDSGRWPQQGAW
ncbi:hypothetical protein [Desulfolutivibrio sulfodismutans]|uniref:hypothetical protein n=1 Tax=Desulfolutivibrio sulfodismutans TaxID=63561 RepID=UPI00159E0156|nr:hypothetical protein [Desulfolutivibrio sulfodismutans]QLA11891.1 hypothetical protein GD606_06255 [Desulfolutivibrio sulfodismutans DSM 3696]QLA13550.1 hypothetical protein GD606_15390 [Desulfolutivibrio sulfodismutans DSM 3696]